MAVFAGTVLVRLASRSDVGQVLKLYQLLAGPYAGDEKPALTEDEVWQLVQDDRRQHLLVTEVSGQVVATLTLIVIPNIGHKGYPWAAVENVVVAEEYRGQGIGAVLMSKATDLCRSLGCYKVVLSSNLVRQEAHDFYRRLGWTESHLGFSVVLQP